MKFASPRGARAVLALIVEIAALVVCLCSCSADPSAWRPEGRASIASWHETRRDGAGFCAVTLRIRNVGSAMIGTSTISLKVSTDLHDYCSTYIDSRIILSDCEIYADIEIPYWEEEETIIDSGPEILDQFYY